MSVRMRAWADGSKAWLVDVTLKGKRIRRQFTTQREAKACEAEMRSLISKGSFRPDGERVTVAQFWPTYLLHLEARNRRGQSMTRSWMTTISGTFDLWVLGTKANQDRNGEKFAGAVGGYKISELDADAINDWCNALLDAGLSVRTVRSYKQQLSGLLKFAVLKKLVTHNAAREVRIIPPRNAKARSRINVPPKWAISRMVELVPEAVGTRYMMTALAGLRPGEVYALRWKHIDFEKGFVCVRTRIDRYHKEDDQGPKSEAGNRDVPLPQVLLGRLKSLVSKAADATDEGLVFPNSRGKFISHDTQSQRVWRPLVKALRESEEGVASSMPPMRYYDMRHFAVSCWIEKGLSPIAVKEFAGHKSLQFTYDTYGHLFPKADHAALMDEIGTEIFA